MGYNVKGEYHPVERKDKGKGIIAGLGWVPRSRV